MIRRLRAAAPGVVGPRPPKGPLVIAATTLGAFLGDLVPYTAGRLFGAHLLADHSRGLRRRYSQGGE